MLVIAHAGHWTSLLLFVPVIGFMVWLAVTQIRERLSGPEGPPRGGGDGDS